MTPVNGALLRRSVEPEVQIAFQALAELVCAPAPTITAAIETRLQNAIYKLQCRAPEHACVAPLAATAANLRLIIEARRQGRCNLSHSQLIRLRKQLFA